MPCFGFGILLSGSTLSTSFIVKCALSIFVYLETDATFQQAVIVSVNPPQTV